MSEQAMPTEATKNLQAAVENTHRTIAALAASKVALVDARQSVDTTAEQISNAARTYRAIEAQLKIDVDVEVEAQIALLDEQLVNSTE